MLRETYMFCIWKVEVVQYMIKYIIGICIYFSAYCHPRQYPVVCLHHILSQTKPCFGSKETPLEAEGWASRSRRQQKGWTDWQRECNRGGELLGPACQCQCWPLCQNLQHQQTGSLAPPTLTLLCLSHTERHLDLRATGLTGAPRPQLLAGKSFTLCDSQLSHGSVAGPTHSAHALQPVRTQLHRFDGWKQDRESTMTCIA